MKKTFEFEVKGHVVRVLNSWFHGAKLYIDGDMRDFDNSKMASGDEILMSARLGDVGILEIVPRSALFSVELDAYLSTPEHRSLVYSSHQRMGIKQKR